MLVIFNKPKMGRIFNSLGDFLNIHITTVKFRLSGLNGTTLITIILTKPDDTN